MLLHISKEKPERILTWLSYYSCYALQQFHRLQHLKIEVFDVNNLVLNKYYVTFKLITYVHVKKVRIIVFQEEITLMSF